MPAGNRLRETELVGNRYSDYFYDAAAQLVRFTERQTVGAQDPRGSYSDDPAIQDDSYAYDAVGNRLSLTDNLTSEQILYTYDDFNKLLTAGNRSFTYDADGDCTSESVQGARVTRTYSWGYNNELLQITYGGGGTNTFSYDGSGRRVSKVDSTGSYSFVYDGNRIISDGQAVYTRAGGSRLISERRGNNSKWYHADGLTSTCTLTNSNQTTTDTFRYDVWSDLAERTGNTPTPHQFVGALGYEREADSGLLHLGFRYYDSSVGRFLSQDPIQAGVNWYVYTENNPVNRVDPTGLDWKLIAIGVGIAIVIGAIIYVLYDKVRQQVKSYPITPAQQGILDNIIEKSPVYKTMPTEFRHALEDGLLTIRPYRDKGPLGGRYFKPNGNTVYIDDRLFNGPPLHLLAVLYGEFQHTKVGGSLDEKEAQKEFEKWARPYYGDPYIRSLRHGGTGGF